MLWVSHVLLQRLRRLTRPIVCTALTVLCLSRRDARSKARVEAKNQDIPVVLSARASSEDRKFGEGGRVMAEVKVVEDFRR